VSGVRSKFIHFAVAGAVAAIGVGHSARAASLYWDINGPTGGASDGSTADGVWDGTAANWSTDASGASLTQTWNPTEVAVFSAGANATGASTIAITGTQTVTGLTIEEGTIIINAGTVSPAGSAITVNAGAVLQTNSSLRIATTAGSVYTLNNGTLRSTNPGANGSFVDNDSTIVLNGGGTLEYTTVNTLNISSNNISGSGPLTKGGAGVLALAGAGTWTGATIINDGELRIRTTANRLPTGTDVTVNSPGILNLNAVAQQIGSLSGNGNVGLGSATLTVSGAANTTFTGSIKDTANAGANGTTATGGKLTKAGAGTLTLNGLSDYTGATTINAGTIALGYTAGQALANTASVTIAGTSSLRLDASNQLGDAAAMTLNGGTFNVNGQDETLGVLSLAGTSAIDFGPGTDSIVQFADSSGATWASGMFLNILNWSGSPAGGGTEQLRFGSSSAALTPAQVSQIRFADAAAAGGFSEATLLPSGEVVPVPEPAAVGLLSLAAMGMLRSRRRS
jgi:autotransporter-associated beta strand protein